MALFRRSNAELRAWTPRDARRRWGVVVALALLVHLGIPLLARVSPASRRASSAAQEPVEALELIDVDLKAPEREVHLQEAQPAPAPAMARPGREEQQRWGIDPKVSSLGAEAGPEPAPAPENALRRRRHKGEHVPAPEREAWTPAVPGLDGAPVWSLPGVLGPTPSPSAGPLADAKARGKALDQGMREELVQNTPLPAAGSIASTIMETVRETAGLLVGRATLRVNVDAQGHVVDVQIVTIAAGHHGAWGRARDAVAASLKGRTLRFPEAFVRGAAVYVDVASTLERRSGGKKLVDFMPAFVEPLPPLPDAASKAGDIRELPEPVRIGVRFTFDVVNLVDPKKRIHQVRSDVRVVPLY